MSTTVKGQLLCLEIVHLVEHIGGHLADQIQLNDKFARNQDVKEPKETYVEVRKEETTVTRVALPKAVNRGQLAGHGRSANGNPRDDDHYLASANMFPNWLVHLQFLQSINYFTSSLQPLKIVEIEIGYHKSRIEAKEEIDPEEKVPILTEHVKANVSVL